MTSSTTESTLWTIHSSCPGDFLTTSFGLCAEPKETSGSVAVSEHKYGKCCEGAKRLIWFVSSSCDWRCWTCLICISKWWNLPRGPRNPHVPRIITPIPIATLQNRWKYLNLQQHLRLNKKIRRLVLHFIWPHRTKGSTWICTST